MSLNLIDVKHTCPIVADYSIKLEASSFAHMFQKILPVKGWADECMVAWSVISNKSLNMAEEDAHIIARGWVHARIKHWEKACAKQTARSNLKGEDAIMRWGSPYSTSLAPLAARATSPALSA